MESAGSAGRPAWPRLERWLLVLVALHSYGVAFFLLFLTEWGARFGGFGVVSPTFFARQAGIFHFVLATGYLIEHFRYGGVTLVLTAKATAVVFLLAMVLLGVDAWSVPLSAAGDGLMGLAIWFVNRRARAHA
jgi:hypothetical protein